MKKKSLFFTVILICSLGLLGCGGGGNDDSDSSPEPYVSFTGTTYSSGGEWSKGLSDSGYGNEPFFTMESDGLYALVCQTASTIAAWNVNSVDHVFIIVDLPATTGTYPSGDSLVRIRLSSINGGIAFTLTGESVTITHVDDDYVEGTFTGLDFNGNTVTGSFVSYKIADNMWPF